MGSTKLRPVNPDDQQPVSERRKQRGTFKAFVSCMLTIIICGGIMGLIGGEGSLLQRTGNGAFGMMVFILGFALQVFLGGAIGYFINRNDRDKGASWGAGIAAALFIFGIFPIIAFFKIKVPL